MSSDNTVYIVDDDAAVRDSLGLLLSLNGYRTAFFADAEAFLQAWTPALRGCMLLDIRMPGMDGLTLQKSLREMGSRLPVLVITGHGDVDSAREAFRSQAVDFLEKPLLKRSWWRRSKKPSCARPATCAPVPRTRPGPGATPA